MPYKQQGDAPIENVVALGKGLQKVSYVTLLIQHNIWFPFHLYWALIQICEVPGFSMSSKLLAGNDYLSYLNIEDAFDLL